MWRIYRKTIFPRWHGNRPVENKSADPSCSKAILTCPINEKKRYSNGSHKHKQDKRCWDNPRFQFNSGRSALLETAGWVGTAAALCINIHLKHIKNVWEHDRPLPSSCVFTRSVLAMPKHSIPTHENALLRAPLPFPLVPKKEINIEKDKVPNDTDILRKIEKLSDEYVAAMQNHVGLVSLNRNDKQAFRSFQAAAHLGSSQAFYNLGLCYELGKGTRVNLQRAAFCYRKAVKKGHGLASFNLAVYFMKGMGGLPVDPDIARLLLEEAATKGVPEAQLYIGIELLEKEKWLDAVAIFKGLAEKSVSDGQYYLGLCFENGWGVERNKQAASQLFAQSAAQGNEKASLKLWSYCKENKTFTDWDRNSSFAVALYQILTQDNIVRENVAKSDTTESSILEKSEKDSIHISASVPELAARMKKSPRRSPSLSYLDSTISSFSLHNTFYKPKVIFSIGKDTIIQNSSNNFVSNRLSDIPLVMQIKT